MIQYQKIQNGFSDWVRFNIALLAVMILTRLLFFIELWFRLHIGAHEFLTILFGSKFDFILTGSVAITTLVPIVAMSYFSSKSVRIFSSVVLYAYALIAFILTEYYCNLSRPLDHIIFAYSPEELKETISSSVSFNWQLLLFLCLHCIAAWCVIKVFSRINFNIKFSIIALVIFSILAFGFKYKSLIKSEKGYESHSDFYLAVNQFSYSYLSITNYTKKTQETIDLREIENCAKEFQSQNSEYTYPNPKYPFERLATDTDVLSQYLAKTSNEKLPNIVFIIIEGFGQKLTGVENPTVSFTPFIDSLASQGLYWSNCISSAERTFGVLPAIFASTPHGEKGFANIWKPIPDHNSILKDFHTNGYYTSFFYGGSASFDGQDLFMKSNNVSFVQNVTIDSSNMKQSFKDNHRWGLDDKEMFELAIEQKKQNNVQSFVDVYLTLTTHEPFELDEMDKYEDFVRKQISKSQNPKEEENILNNKNIFACFAYTDDCVRQLFDYYKTREDYKNTIFVITGDHRMCPLGTSNPLMKYHVPLIIYSPLITHPKKMNGIVSHYDIAPSFTAYLSKNYDYSTSDLCHWVGSSFDTSATFHCVKKQAFMLNNRDVVDYIADSLLLSDNRLFRVKNNLEVEKIDKDSLLQLLQNQLREYQTLSVYAIENDYLRHPLTNNVVLLLQELVDFEKSQTADFSKTYVDSNDNTWGEIDAEDEYTNLSTLEIKNTCKNIHCEVQFGIKSLDTTKELPILIISKMGNQPYYVTKSMSSPTKQNLNTSDKELFSCRFTIPNVEQETSTLKLYLWNQNKAHVLYDNIAIKISGDEN